MACGYREQPFEVEKEHVSYVKNYQVRLQIRVDAINGRYISREVFDGEENVQDTLFYYPKNQEELDGDWMRIAFDKKLNMSAIEWILIYLKTLSLFELIREWKDIVIQPHIRLKTLKCQLRVEAHIAAYHSDGSVTLH